MCLKLNISCIYDIKLINEYDFDEFNKETSNIIARLIDKIKYYYYYV